MKHDVSSTTKIVEKMLFTSSWYSIGNSSPGTSSSLISSFFEFPTVTVLIAITATISLAILVNIVLMSFITKTSSNNNAAASLLLLRHLCIFCPPLFRSNVVAGCDDDDDNDEEEQEEADNVRGNKDGNILFIPKGPKPSLETTIGTSLDNDEEIIETSTRDIVNSLQLKSVKSTDSTVKQGRVGQRREQQQQPLQKPSYNQTTKTKMKRVKIVVVANNLPMEETSHDPTEEIRLESFTAENDDIIIDMDGKDLNEMQLTSQCEYNDDDDDDDDQSDASDLTMPCFRPGHGNIKKRVTSPLKSKLFEKVQKIGVYARIKSLRMNQREKWTQQDGSNHINAGMVSKKVSNNNRNNNNNNVPSCSCLILLMEPTSHTFEILPISYLPGVSFVSDLLEQIPLKSSFNFRLRFQNYSGLMSMELIMDSDSLSSPSSLKAHQLPQSKPVPMRYSCEFHHYQKHLPNNVDNPFQNQNSILPLVAILPEKNSDDSGAVDRTEQLAKKLLCIPNVQRRLDFLHEWILSSVAAAASSSSLSSSLEVDSIDNEMYGIDNHQL
jgi:hypothetical protein